MPVADPRPIAGRAARWLFVLLAVLVAGLLGALAVRSTETWIPSDPDAVRRLLELRQHERDLVHGWERAQRGDTRFEYDTEIRFVAGRIEELESFAGRPRRVHGVDPWAAVLGEARPVATIVVEVLLETLATVGLAFAAVAGLGRLSRGARRLALVALLAPLALPVPLLADATRRLGAVVGLSPSPLFADVVEVLATLPFAVAILRVAATRVDGRRLDAACDLGFSRVAIFGRVVLPSLAPALVFASLFAGGRLVGDLSIARAIGVDEAPHRLAEWLRHRIVASVDFPAAAAGSLIAVLAGLALAGLAVAALRRLAEPRRPAPPSRPRTDRPRAALGLPLLLPLLVPVALILLPSAGAAAAGVDERLAALVCEWGRAGVAAALGLGLAVALLPTAEAPDRGRRSTAVAFALVAVPTPAIAFALRLLAQDLDLPAGVWPTIPATALAAAGPAFALLLAAGPDGGAVAGRHGDLLEAFRLRFASVLPLAALLAFATALAAADVGTVLGVVDRSALFGAVATDETDLAAPLAAAISVVFGIVAAAALERISGGDRRRSGLDF